MKQKISKTESILIIDNFFKEIKSKTPTEIRKIKRLAMNKKIPLKDKKKLFCKYCLSPYSGKEKIRIKNLNKVLECLNCRKVNRWKIKLS